MSSKTRYQVAATVDTLLLWGRLGGGYVFIALIALVFVRAIAGLPDWLAPVLLLVALGSAVIAAFRLRPYLSVRKNGIQIEGRISDIEERRKQHSNDGGVLLKKRLTFRYEMEGAEHTGRTTWKSSGQFGTLAR